MSGSSSPPSRARTDRAALTEGLCRVAAEIGARGWCQGTSGNFSAVLSRQPLRLLITRSGATKYRLTAEDLVEVDVDGRAVAGEPARPSAETGLHCRIAQLTGAGSVLHTHSVPATLLGEHFRAAGGFRIGGYEMLKGFAGIASHEEEIFVPVIPNSQDIPLLCRGLESAHREHQALHGFLLAAHGLYTWGRDLQEAQRHLEIFEFLLECVARRTRFRPIADGGVD